MELFYTTTIQNDIALFDENEGRHIAKAYRKRLGDALHFTDGQGMLYEGKITAQDRKSLTCQITDKQEVAKTWSGHLTMAMAPTKNFNRTEWLVEKMVELGIDRIIPLETEHTERKKWKMDRLERIMIGAMKQSIKTHLPILDPPTEFKDLLNQWDTQQHPTYIGHCRDGEKMALKDIPLMDKSVLFLVGPEGDFSTREISLALESGCRAISLGKTRLRTETAAFKMATAFQILNTLYD